MTTERAIEILDPEHREHYETIEPVNEACRTLVGSNPYCKYCGQALDWSDTKCPIKN